MRFRDARLVCGWVEHGDFNEEMDKIAFAMKAGGVIEDATHFRILKVVERREKGTPPPLDEVREKIVAELKDESRKKRVAGWIEEAKEELAKDRKAREEEGRKSPTVELADGFWGSADGIAPPLQSLTDS